MPRQRQYWWLLLIVSLISFGWAPIMSQASSVRTSTMLELLDWPGPPNLSQFEQTSPQQYQAAPTLVPSKQMAQALQSPAHEQATKKATGWLPQTNEIQQLLLVLAGVVGLLGIWFIGLFWQRRRE